MYTRRQEEILEAEEEKNYSGLAYDYYDEGVCYYHLGLAAREGGDEEKACRQLELALKQLKRALESNLRMRGEIAMDTIDNEEYLADTYARLGVTEMPPTIIWRSLPLWSSSSERTAKESRW